MRISFDKHSVFTLKTDLGTNANSDTGTFIEEDKHPDDPKKSSIDSQSDGITDTSDTVAMRLFESSNSMIQFQLTYTQSALCVS